MKSPEGGENGGRKITSGLRNVEIRPQYLGEYKIQRNSILKIGMKSSRKKTNGKHNWQRISQMAFYGEGLEINPVGRQSYLKSPYSTPRGRM